MIKNSYLKSSSTFAFILFAVVVNRVLIAKTSSNPSPHPVSISVRKSSLINYFTKVLLKQNVFTFVGPQSAPHIALRGVQNVSVTRVFSSSRVVTLVMLLVFIGGITNLLSTILSIRKWSKSKKY